MNTLTKRKITSTIIISILVILTICGISKNWYGDNIKTKTIHIANKEIIPISHIVYTNIDAEYITLKIKYDKKLNKPIASMLYIQDTNGITNNVNLDKKTTNALIDYVCKDKRKY